MELPSCVQERMIVNYCPFIDPLVLLATIAKTTRLTSTNRLFVRNKNDIAKILNS